MSINVYSAFLMSPVVNVSKSVAENNTNDPKRNRYDLRHEKNGILLNMSTSSSITKPWFNLQK